MSLCSWFGKLFEAVIEAKPTPVYPKGVELAGAYLAADPQNKFGNPRYIAEIDYSKKSSEKRFAIWDRVENKVSYHKVSHGSGTGTKPHNGFCVEFSNSDGSHMTCLGAFKTGETYNGQNGFSLRLDGLDPTNSNARSRAVVLHGSDYVHDADSGICGRSWGCPSMDYKVVKDIIAKLEGGSLLLSHYNGHFKYTTDPRPDTVLSNGAPAQAQLRTFFPNPAWADHALKLVKASRLPSSRASDVWFKNTPENWVYLLAAMAKYESSYKPETTYKENFKNDKGEYVISTGLFQLSYESVGGYGYKVTTEQLKDPFLNIEIAIKILEKWVVSDGYIAGNGQSPYKGGARYWSVLRASGKLEQVKSTYKSQVI